MPQQYLEDLTDEVVIDKAITMNPVYLAWQKSDRLLRGWITGTLSKETLGIGVRFDISDEVWKALKDTFAQSIQDRKFTLEERTLPSSQE